MPKNDKPAVEGELVAADQHDYDGRITKTNEFINCRYGDKFSSFETKVFSLMMGKINPKEEEFKDESIYVADLAERFGHSPNYLYSRLDKFSDKATQCAMDHKRENGSYRKIPFLQHFSYISASESDDGRAKITWRFNDKMSPFMLGIDGTETPYTVLFFERFKRLSTKYAPRLYELLQQLIDFNQRRFTVDSFREKLDLVTKYKTYGLLKNKVIQPAVKDINQYTDLNVVFDDITAGQKVIGIKFRMWIDEDFIKTVVNKGQEVVEVDPLTSGLKNEADFIKKMKEMFDENQNIKFERKVRRLSKKDYNRLIEEFEAEFKLDGFSNAATSYRKGGLNSPAIYSMFRGWAAHIILGRKTDHDFKAFMESKGHPIQADSSGKFRLKRPVLTET